MIKLKKVGVGKYPIKSQEIFKSSSVIISNSENISKKFNNKTKIKFQVSFKEIIKLKITLNNFKLSFDLEWIRMDVITKPTK